mgnify:CR=1 FL=1
MEPQLFERPGGPELRKVADVDLNPDTAHIPPQEELLAPSLLGVTPRALEA